MISIGSKVYVLYIPESSCVPGAEHARCQIATVTGGPYGPLELPNQSIHRCWVIQPESGGDVMAAEKILTPYNPAKDKARECEVAV